MKFLLREYKGFMFKWTLLHLIFLLNECFTVEVEEGEKAVLTCRGKKSIIKDCVFMTPGNVNFTQSSLPEKDKDRIRFEQEEKHCKITIDPIQQSDFGDWSCFISIQRGEKMKTLKRTSSISHRKGKIFNYVFCMFDFIII